MIDGIGPEVAAEQVHERLGAHGALIRRGLDGGERDAASRAAAPPLVGPAPLGIRAGDLETPALVTDGDGRAPVADRWSVGAVTLGPGDDLPGHRIVDAAHLDDLGPGAPRVGEVRVHRVGAGQDPVDLVEQRTFLLDGRSAPADIEPHQGERPVQEASTIRCVGPPRRDVRRDTRVGDGGFEPAVIARTEDGGDRTIERIVGRARDPDLQAGMAGRPARACTDERLAEPPEVAVLRRGSVGEGGPRVARDRLSGLGAVPRDRQIHTEPLDEATDEPVIPGTHGHGFAADRHASGIAGGDQEVGGPRVECDGQLGVAALDSPPGGASDCLAVLGQQPRLDAFEQALPGRHAHDQAAP